MTQIRDPRSGKFTTIQKIKSEVSKANGDGNTSGGMSNELGSDGGIAGTNLAEFLYQLRGRQGVKVYREMSDNDPIIGSILFAIEMLIREVTWSVQPFDESPQSEEQAAFVEGEMHSMSHTWNDFMASVMSEFVYGWAFFEIVYEQVDGMVGWEKFGYRPQETMLGWTEEGMKQQLPTGGAVLIPYEKALHFRTTTTRGPEGRSMLRNAYRPWFFKKRLEELLVIGSERNLAGLPVAEIPAEILIAGKGDPTHDAILDIITSTKRDEQEGVMWPREFDDAGNLMYEFKLLTGGGEGRLGEVRDAIRMFAMDMAGTTMADFLGLGRDAVGSRALAEPKQALFLVALGAIVDALTETIQRQAVDRLAALNGWNPPELVHGEVKDVDLQGLAQVILQTSQAGMDWGFGAEGETITEAVRTMAGFDPQPTTEAMEKGVYYDLATKSYLPTR
jgi:hypothetical protein